jgi:S-adenosylmethionine synthetase
VGVREITLEALGDVAVARRRTELVERKGLGHPDSMCDALVETASAALGRMYLERTGRILHYNLDKALLVAGACPKGFGWGELTRPMELIVGDRATFAVDGTALPVEEVVRGAVDSWVAAQLPHVRPGRDLVTRVVLAPGSEELISIFHDGDRAAVANDTSAASAWAPLSPTEELVLAVERFLNGAAFKERFPDTGQDVKVFARRRDARMDVTVAMPMLCLTTATERTYFRRKEEILAALAERFRQAPFEAIAWSLNALDRPGRGAAGAYLSLTGTSAEDADSGQVGRGNRVNGLIALGRPSTSEAAPGKNPVAHVGKIYSVLSHRLAELIHARCPELEEAYVYIAARIGDPIDQPWTSVQVVLRRGAGLGDIESAIAGVVEAELARLPTLCRELIRGEYAVC